MDKTWMNQSRGSNAFIGGVQQFLEFAFSRTSHNGKILCPCKDCSNRFWVTQGEARDHLLIRGFLNGYTHWVLHGEGSSYSSSHDEATFPENTTYNHQMDEMLQDIFPMDLPDESTDVPNPEAAKLYKLIEDGQRELYPGCKTHSKLSFLIELYLIKCMGKWTDKSFSKLLHLLKIVLPQGETLPNSFYETKKYIGELGLNYEKIDACENDCMLFRKDHVHDSECSICGSSRWKLDSSKKSGKIPVKVLRYFPLKPRLQRLFMSSKTSSLMKWHEEGRTKDGKLRHPADSPAWKTFDHLHNDFSSDSRNVRLGLAADGFNPFRTMTVSHSTWPVILMAYNLPPWKCMKQSYLMLSLLIPGPTAPGNDIDVYMQPLIEELMELWEVGVTTYDVVAKQNFNLRAALLWTVSDFPGYANLSGWSTKGKLACPSCHKDTQSQWLKHSKKFCYMGHRRFLNHGHVFRRQKRCFDNTQELRIKPKRLTGYEIMNELRGNNITFGKKMQNTPLPHSWKKLSIFFMLPYWKDNIIRHNLDVMHIEKNVCESILGTLLNTPKKTKDHLNSRRDLQVLGIRHELHLREHASGKTYMPPACFSLDAKQKREMCKFLKRIKVPNGYSADISRCVDLKQCRVTGLKSHDCHILLHQILPLAIRRILPKQVSSPLIDFCSFFRELCSKVCRVQDFDKLESHITLALCHFERIFPPSFFDVMVHLCVHLVEEAKVAGPVHYRWMYPIERYLLTLKTYVRNRSRPEGSIAEGFLVEECLTFCSRYLHGVETRENRIGRNDDLRNHNHLGHQSEDSSVFSIYGWPLGTGKLVTIDNDTLQKAHRYVLNNCDVVSPFIEQHLSLMRSQNPRSLPHNIRSMHNRQFPSWFANEIQANDYATNAIDEELKILACPPNIVGREFSGYHVNGFTFHPEDVQVRRATQNSGVVVTAKTESFASARDRNPIDGEVTYYGIVRNIIELDYKRKKVILFKCDWISHNRGLKEDEFGFTLVNFSRLLNQEEPFILASQAEQVFYIEDSADDNWRVVVRTTPRDLYDMKEDANDECFQSEPLVNSSDRHTMEYNDDNVSWVRTDIAGTVIDEPFQFNSIPRDEQQYEESNRDDLL